MELEVITINPVEFVQTDSIISKADKDVKEDEGSVGQEEEILTQEPSNHGLPITHHEETKFAHLKDTMAYAFFVVDVDISFTYCGAVSNSGVEK